MRKFQFLIAVIGLSIVGNTNIYAHTISRHIEELYGDTYLPLFILGKLLPFLGLGMLSFGIKAFKMPINKLFVFVFMIGIALGFLFNGFALAFLLNNLAVLAIGVILLAFTVNLRYWIAGLFMLFGLSMGYEHGLYISHAHDFTWVYISIAGLRLLLFFLLRKTSFIRNPRRKILVYSMGIFMVLAGITLILLA